MVNIHIAIIHFLSPEKNTFNLSFTKQSLSVEFQLLGSDNKGGNFEKKKKAAKKYNKEIFNGEEKMFNKKMLKINI